MTEGDPLRSLDLDPPSAKLAEEQRRLSIVPHVEGCSESSQPRPCCPCWPGGAAEAPDPRGPGVRWPGSQAGDCGSPSIRWLRTHESPAHKRALDADRTRPLFLPASGRRAQLQTGGQPAHRPGCVPAGVPSSPKHRREAGLCVPGAGPPRSPPRTPIGLRAPRDAHPAPTPLLRLRAGEQSVRD